MHRFLKVCVRFSALAGCIDNRSRWNRSSLVQGKAAWNLCIQNVVFHLCMCPLRCRLTSAQCPQVWSEWILSKSECSSGGFFSSHIGGQLLGFRGNNANQLSEYVYICTSQDFHHRHLLPSDVGGNTNQGFTPEIRRWTGLHGRTNNYILLASVLVELLLANLCQTWISHSKCFMGHLDPFSGGKALN